MRFRSTELSGRHRVGASAPPALHVPRVTKVGDRSTAGVMKDTINMDRFSTVEIDFTADDPGPTLLHCHHQDHQDEGFMGLVTYL
jgi:FtsP/CotA-like multicopper oxidase with cupredoxin domain